MDVSEQTISLFDSSRISTHIRPHNAQWFTLTDSDQESVETELGQPSIVDHVTDLVQPQSFTYPSTGATLLVAEAPDSVTVARQSITPPPPPAAISSHGHKWELYSGNKVDVHKNKWWWRVPSGSCTYDTMHFFLEDHPGLWQKFSDPNRPAGFDVWWMHANTHEWFYARELAPTQIPQSSRYSPRDVD